MILGSSIENFSSICPAAAELHKNYQLWSDMELNVFQFKTGSSKSFSIVSFIQSFRYFEEFTEKNVFTEDIIVERVILL